MLPHRCQLDAHFPRYMQFEPRIQVWQVSPAGTPAIHRFFDTSPLSPSGRFIALTQFETDTRLPRPGDRAYVVVVDLTTGESVFRRPTFGWDSQLGAQVQWGASDNALIYNDMDTQHWQPFGVVADIKAQTVHPLGGTVYMVSHDGREALSPCLRRIADIQAGYGVVVPAQARPASTGASAKDGVIRVDMCTGQASLWLSVREMVERLPQAFTATDLHAGQFYVFHVKWSPDDQRVMIVLRYRGPRQTTGHQKTWLLTTDRDARSLHVALGPDAWVGGHHPNWCPDSTHIIMNVVMPLRRTPLRTLAWTVERAARRLGMRVQTGAYALRFVSFRYDGADLRVLSDRYNGSGHPTMHPTQGAILSDAYPHEPVAAGDGSVPLRWITANGTTTENLVRMPVKTPFTGPRSEWRVDLHPAWDRTQRFVTFNGAPQGTRSVFVADLLPYLEGAA